ncbi:MAG TPA: phosphomannomutase/phosphoglucomutase [Pseudomonadales bacterium]|nr:phosphomannomutase/phosphoglucomutase [Pseudomonadales bacterium]
MSASRKGGKAASDDRKQKAGKKAQKKDAPASPAGGKRKPGAVMGRTISRMPISPAHTGFGAIVSATALVLSVAAAAILASVLLVTPANRTHDALLAEARAAQVASQVDRVTRNLREQVARLASSSLAAEALRLEEGPARRAAEDRLATLLPNALRVRVNAYGRADLALSEAPPLTYAGIDQIRRAEQGAAAGPELLATAGGAVLNVSAPIPSGQNQPLGALMVTFTAEPIASILAGLPADGAGVRIVQNFEGSTADVAARSGGSGAQDTLTVPLEVPRWTLDYAPGNDGTLASPALLAPSWLLILLLVGTALFLTQRRLSSSVANDMDLMLESVNSLLMQRSAVDPRQYLLDDFAEGSATLTELFAAAKLTPGAKPPPKPVTVGKRVEVPSMGVEEVEADDAGEEDDSFLDIDDETQRVAAQPTEAAVAVAEPAVTVAAEIFRAYDIRGIVGDTLTEQAARLIGRAIGSEVAAAGESTVIVACDGRESSPGLKAALTEGLLAAGRDVVDIGDAPTPLLYFATETTGFRSGVMVTGSHNPRDYNGFKVVIGGEALADGRITALHERITSARFESGAGTRSTLDLLDAYVNRIAEDVALAQPLKIVVDCGNGIAGLLMPRVLEAIGCEVLPLYCDVDGSFPNHHPDPADPKNLEDLATVVRAEGADLGIALDGDGDRIGAVDEKGAIIWPDRLLMLFSRDIVGRNPGTDVVFDVKCSRHLNSVIAEYGGRPIMWKTGHSHMKAKLRETGALLAGEFSGHICFAERWFGFDDGLYAGARLLEILAGEARPASEIFGEFPPAVSTPELKVTTTEAGKFQIMERIADSTEFAGGDINGIDGLRVDFPEGWGLVRPSNTSPALTLRFEADTGEHMRAIAARFHKALVAVDPALDFKLP